jgi:hypothetical protein
MSTLHEDPTTFQNLTVTGTLTTSGATVVGGDVFLAFDVGTLVGTGVYGIPSPVAGTIIRIQSRLRGALTTGNATLTAKIGATAVTTGVLTITQAASAAGDIDVCEPTAARTVAVGSNINVTVGGTNDAAVGADVVVTIRRTA